MYPANITRITEQVSEVLKQHPELWNVQISATVKDDTVTLHGDLADDAQRQKAIAAVRAVYGVKDVKDKTKVVGPLGSDGHRMENVENYKPPQIRTKPNRPRHMYPNADEELQPNGDNMP